MKKYILFCFVFFAMSKVVATTFSVTNTNATGNGSLVEALSLANADVSSTELNPHVIEFSSLLVADDRIVITGQLQIVRPMVIDGGTHPSGNLTIDAGGNAIVSFNFFEILPSANPAGSILRNLTVINSAANSVQMDNVRNISIFGCRIGVEEDGITVSSNVNGVFLFNGTTDITIDSTLISGNSSNGLLIQDALTGSIIIRNSKIGVDVLGNTKLPNSANGIHILNSTTPVQVLNNVISGNNSNGVLVQNSSNQVIKGNNIGVGFDGLTELGNGANGIEITSSNSNTIGGNITDDRNIVSGNLSNGIRIFQSSANHILGNFIGTDITGSLAISNFQGINVQGINSINNLIGDVNFLGRNVISGNESHGVFFELDASNNEVYGNYIGTDSTGLVRNGNGRNGVSGTGSGSVLVGGSDVNRRNVIAGNGFNDFLPDEGPYFSGISFSNSTDLTVKSNYIGLGSDGVTEIANANYGIWYFNSDNLLVGGDLVNERNVISGNGSLALNPQSSQNVAPEEQSSRGVYVIDGDQIEISGNYVGTDFTGQVAKPNLADGIVIINSNNIVIGGSVEKSNLVSGNTFSGVYLYNSTNATVSFNLLGLTAGGTSALANGYDGLFLQSQDNTIVTDNISSGNGQTGIHIFGGESNQILNNFIGVAEDKTSSLGNDDGGIRIISTADDSQNNLIKGNLISNGTGINSGSLIGDGYGVYVGGTGSFQNKITENSISCNNGLSINLQLAGSSFGTPFEGNVGKEAPIIDPSISTSTVTAGTGVSNDTIEVFSNPSACGCDAELLLGKTIVGTDGTWSFTHGTIDPGQVSAVAIDQLGNTSEVACKKVKAGIIDAIVENCVGLPVTITLNEAVASTIRWQISQSNDFSILVVDSVTASNDPVILDFIPENNNPYFVRAISILTTFSTDTSEVVSWSAIQNQTIGDLQISGSNSICSGTSSIITVENNVATSYRWFDSTATGGWESLSSSVESISVTPTEDTYYRAIPLGVECISPSDTVLIEVLDTVFASVSITIDTNDICDGESQEFSSEVINSGINATYEWFVNNVSTSSNDSLFGIFENGDIISLIITPDTTCPSQTTYQSNSINVVTNVLGNLTAEISPYEQCINDGVLELNLLSNESINLLNIEWYVNGIPQLNDSSFFSYDPEVGDEVYADVKSSNRCLVSDTVATDTINIEFSRGVVANAGDDLTVKFNSTINLDGSSSSNAITYTWEKLVNSVPLQVGNSVIYTEVAEEDFSTYILTASNGFCDDKDTVNVIAEREDIFIPNAFSPNGDLIHDSWEIKNIEFFKDAEVSIFNVWGSEVFSSDNTDFSNSKVWDGTNNGIQMPVGTYYYVLELNDGSDARSGYVNILK